MPNPGADAQQEDQAEHAFGGWMSEIPLTPLWLAREFNEAVFGTEYESELVPGFVDVVVDPLVEKAGEQVGTALVVAGVAGTVGLLGLAGLALVAWKLK